MTSTLNARAQAGSCAGFEIRITKFIFMLNQSFLSLAQLNEETEKVVLA
jgi:hypothetical protein